MADFCQRFELILLSLKNNRLRKILNKNITSGCESSVPAISSIVSYASSFYKFLTVIIA